MLQGSRGSKGYGLLLGLFSGGSVLNYASPAGTVNNVNPGGSWPAPNVGRILVSTAAGPAAWTGLLATTQDGQGVQIKNEGPNVLLLDNLNAGSVATNQFQWVTDLTLPVGDSVIAVYWVSIGNWVITA